MANNVIPDVRNREVCVISKCETEWLPVNILTRDINERSPSIERETLRRNSKLKFKLKPQLDRA
jgi:hypothetical protein